MQDPAFSHPIRLAALAATGLLDQPRATELDTYCTMARGLGSASAAFVTLVLPDRQIFVAADGLSHVGLPEREAPIEESLCQHVVRGACQIAIDDLVHDAVFCRHPAVSKSKIRSYLGTPVTTADGTVLGAICLADVTARVWSPEVRRHLSVLAQAVATSLQLRQTLQARREIERSARSEHELLAQIIATSVAAITVLDREGNIVFCNPNAERILGLTRSEIEERRFDSPAWRCTAMDGGKWTEQDQPFTRVQRSGQAVDDIQHAIEWPDGSRRYLSVNGAPIRNEDGEIDRLVFLVNDITEAHLARQQLRQAAEQFIQVFRVSPHFAVLCAREDGTIIEVSSGFCHSLRRERVDCIGRSLVELGVGFPAALAHSLFDTSDHPLPGEELSLNLHTADGRLRIIHVRPLALTVGDDPLVLLTGDDLTEQREQETRRLALEAQLREAQKIETVGRLAGGIAHDFNNILTAIIGNAELARRILPAEHPTVPMIDTIKRAGRRAADQVRQILDFSRRDQADRALIALGPLIDETVELIRSRLPAGVTVAVEAGDAVGEVVANAGQLHQILMNLLTNAAHAVGAQGRITVRMQATRDTGGQLAIEVADTGIGIDPIHLDRIFEPFFTTRGPGVGTGIGLALARAIARNHGGDLTVKSRRGDTVFRLLLPSVPPTSRETSSPSTTANGSRPVPSTARTRIMLVDDEPEVLHTSRLMLEQLGHHVETCRDGATALDALRLNPDRFDLVLTDHLMPRMHGLELAACLRATHCRTPIILMSGYGLPEQAAPELARLETSFLAKPFTVQEISDAISRALQHSPSVDGRETPFAVETMTRP